MSQTHRGVSCEWDEDSHRIGTGAPFPRYLTVRSKPTAACAGQAGAKIGRKAKVSLEGKSTATTGEVIAVDERVVERRSNANPTAMACQRMRRLASTGTAP